jgi:L-aspartate oxidase
MRPSNWLQLRSYRPVTAARTDDVVKVRERIQHDMAVGAGVVRDAESLHRVELGMPEDADRVDVCEVRNLATVGAGLVAAALAREESRGCHTRTDFPETSPRFARRLVLT